MGQLTAPAVRARKVARGADPLVMVTAYDAPGARIADEAGVDLILVGDSLAMVVLGYDDTLQVTTDDMAHHVSAVARGLKSQPNPKAMIVGDLPWLSYHVSTEDTVRNAAAGDLPRWLVGRVHQQHPSRVIPEQGARPDELQSASSCGYWVQHE
jgi:predicted RecB family endonuclease